MPVLMPLSRFVELFSVLLLIELTSSSLTLVRFGSDMMMLYVSGAAFD